MTRQREHDEQPPIMPNSATFNRCALFIFSFSFVSLPFYLFILFGERKPIHVLHHYTFFDRVLRKQNKDTKNTSLLYDFGLKEEEKNIRKKNRNRYL